METNINNAKNHEIKVAELLDAMCTYAATNWEDNICCCNEDGSPLKTSDGEIITNEDIHKYAKSNNYTIAYKDQKVYISWVDISRY